MTETINQLDLIIDDTPSIDDLVRLQTEGISVVRSAHVGNFSAYNLTLAEAGIPILTVDHTITGVDSNYFPERILTQTDEKQVADVGKLVCRAMSTEGVFLDELHLGALAEIMPSSNIFTNTEYLRANEQVAGETIRIAAKEFPGLFARLALPDGTARKQPNAAGLIGVFGVMQLNDNPRAEEEAVLIPNEVDILANFVIEALNSERDVQYHLSGPDMVVYIEAILPMLKLLYARLGRVASFGSKLPPELKVRLVPTTPARFATTKDRSEKLDDLLSTFEASESEYAAIKGQKDAFFKSDQPIEPSAKRSFLAGVDSNKTEVDLKLRNRLSTIPELFIAPNRDKKTRGFITQYDVRDEGGLYVPGINKETPMSDLAKLFSNLLAARKRLVK